MRVAKAYNGVNDRMNIHLSFSCHDDFSFWCSSDWRALNISDGLARATLVRMEYGTIGTEALSVERSGKASSVRFDSPWTIDLLVEDTKSPGPVTLAGLFMVKF
jgi:hypothetical protein